MGESERARAADIAIVGMGCRFPGGANLPETFWNNLVAGVDAITPVPPDRWDNDAFCNPATAAPGDLSMRWGGFVGDAGLFDAAFFGISPKEAVRMDPQQRMLLEVAWESLEDAGIPAESLRGSRTGVFVGVQSQSIDYYFLQLADIGNVEFSANTGGAHSIIANRLSYVLDLRGPSFTVDTACSSSLVALHLACQSLRSGECDLAFSGGTNLIAAPETSIAYTKLGFMAPDGRCKTFDSRANGFVRGEGCGVVLLKRLADALRDHDPVIAVIRGTAVNQDGTTNGLTAPNGLAQQSVIREALASARVEPSRIGYVETHGTGTILGDPIEVEALSAVLAGGATGDNPCYLGAVKTNIGHLESAAGIAGVIKAALCLQHRFVPPNLHFRKLNPHIRLDGTRLRIPAQGCAWAATDGPRFAGVSSFGFGGTNGHAILEEAPAIIEEAEQASTEGSIHFVLPISGHDRKALAEAAQTYTAFLESERGSKLSLKDIARSASLHRSHLTARAAVVGPTKTQWIEGLRQIADAGTGALPEKDRPGVAVGSAGGRPQVVFVYSGQGQQWFGMGRELFEREPVYRHAIEKCASMLGPWSLIEELGRDEAASRLGETEIAQPAVFSLQIALTELLRSWGVRPDLVIGHSLGEVAAACAAGAISLEDALRVVTHRGRLMQQAAGKGRMAAVGLSADQALEQIKEYGDLLVVAVFNSPTSVVLSGESEALQKVLARLETKGVFNRLLPGDCPFHSPVMEPLRAELERSIEGIKVRTAEVPIVSTVSGLPAARTDYGPGYWGRNIRQPVRFAEAVQQAARLGGQVFLEIGPHPVLGSPLLQCLADVEGTVILSSLKRGSPEQASMLTALAGLHVAGYPVEWMSLFPEAGPRASLPHYPWQHARFWIGTRSMQQAVHREPRLEGQQNGLGLYEVKWVEKARRAEKTKMPGRTGWLVLADAGGMGRALVEEIGRRSEPCVVTRSLDELTASLKRIAGSQDPDVWNVVSLQALDARPPAEADLLTSDRAFGAAFDAGRRMSCDVPTRLAQALHAEDGKVHLRLWLVTRGAQAIRNSTPGFMQAPVWGLGRTLAFEMPDIWGGLVDLDPKADASHAATALIQEILHPDDDDQIVFRGEDRLVPRLCQLDTEGHSQQTSLCAYDGAYLVTGDPNGLGTRVALWLANQGARHLVILGGGSGSAGIVASDERLRSIRNLGASIEIVRGDVGDPATVAGVLGKFGRSLPALKGIVHAAGRLEPASAGAIDDSLIGRTFHEKAEGALLLHSLSRELQLDFFVLFSSVSAIMGSRELAHFGAAGQLLDALACYRHERGLPALSVDWGWWPEGGTAEALDAYYPRIGLNPMSSTEALGGLAELLQAGRTQGVVTSVRWEVFKPVCEARGPFPFLDEIRLEQATPEAPSGSADTEFMRRWPQVAADDRHDVLVAHLRGELSQVLGFEHPEDIDLREGFFNMGMDSITTLQFTRRLEQSLGHAFPATLAFEHPNIESLCRHILARVLGGETAPSAEAESVEEDSERFRNLTEEQLVAMLEQKLKALDG